MRSFLLGFTRTIGAVLLAGLSVSPLVAQPQKLDVQDDASWQHTATGIVMPPTIGEYDRSDITSTAKYELDMQVQYANGLDTYITAYIFRPAIGTLPVWFDRSKTVLETTEQWQAGTPAEIEKSFVPPKRENTSAFMAIYKSGNPRFSYTGVALIPVNGWFVKLRMTSLRKNGRELEADMQSFLQGISWPENMKKAENAVPVSRCEDDIRFGKKAKKLKKDGAQALLGALMGSIASKIEADDPEKADARPITYCRSQYIEDLYGIYQDADSGGYLMAIRDAGRGIRAGKGINLGGGGDRYSVTFFDMAESRQFPDYDRLPPPEQLLEILGREKPLSVTPTFGEDRGTVILGPDSF